MAPYCPPIAHYAHINFPVEAGTQAMKYAMGINGVNLYNWTQKFGLQYVWLDYKSKRLELWGNEGAFQKGATMYIQNMINRKLKEYETKQIASTEKTEQNDQ